MPEPQRSQCTHREILGEIKYWCDFNTQWVFKIFMVLLKILFVVHLKHFTFWPSADVKPISNDKMPSSECLLSLSLCVCVCVCCDVYGWSHRRRILILDIYGRSLFHRRQQMKWSHKRRISILDIYGRSLFHGRHWMKWSHKR